MAVSIRDNLHTSFAESFYSDIVSGRDNYYYFIGGNLPWGTTDVPPTFTGTNQEDFDTKNDIVLIKKILAGDVSCGVARHDWVTGTVYQMYDSSVLLAGTNFYCMTDEFNVYKCLSNNYGAASTNKPSGTDYTPVTYADGYIWKFLYNIPLSVRNKFLTNTVMPTFKALTSHFFSNGKIDKVLINGTGSGYLGEPVVTITINSPTGTGAQVYPVIDSNGSIVSVYIKNAGTGYLQSNTTLTITGDSSVTGKYPGNSTAILQPKVLAGKIDYITIVDPGLNYSSDIKTTITVSGDGTGAKFTPFILDGKIADVIIENPGIGYSYAALNVVSVNNPATGLPYGTGAKLTANLDAGKLESIQSIVEQTSIDGGIHFIKVTTQGTGYVTAPTVSIAGDGVNATATANIAAGKVVGITMTNPGFGYTYATVTITGGSGSNAVARAIISPDGGHGRNAVTELNSDLVIISGNINNDPAKGIFFENEYRQYGIIKNPTYYKSTNSYDKTIGSPCFLITVDTPVNIQVNTTITVSTTKVFDVIYVSGNQVLCRPIKHNDLVVADEVVRNDHDGSFFRVITSVYPDINRNSGRLQYVNNQMSIDYSGQQSLTLKTIFAL